MSFVFNEVKPREMLRENKIEFYLHLIESWMKHRGVSASFAGEGNDLLFERWQHVGGL